MNIKHLVTLIAATIIAAAAPLSNAQDKERPAKMPDVLESLTPIKGEIDTKAKFFIYLQSASWCPPCRAEMPKIAAEYPDMKKADVEIILCSWDQTEEAAVKFLETNKAEFPAIMKEAALSLPGFTCASGIPYAIMVNKKGEVIHAGHAGFLQDWKSYLKKKPMPSGKDATVSAILKKQVKPFTGRPSKNAKYYVYLQSASWCGPCQQEMPDIVEIYPDMKKAGVEIILCSWDRNKGAAQGFLKSHKAKFPAVMKEQAGALPGFQLADGIPFAIIVTEEGKPITSGHGSIVKQWESIISEWEAQHAPQEDSTHEESAEGNTANDSDSKE